MSRNTSMIKSLIKLCLGCVSICYLGTSIAAAAPVAGNPSLPAASVPQVRLTLPSTPTVSAQGLLEIQATVTNDSDFSLADLGIVSILQQMQTLPATAANQPSDKIGLSIKGNQQATVRAAQDVAAYTNPDLIVLERHQTKSLTLHQPLPASLSTAGGYSVTLKVVGRSGYILANASRSLVKELHGSDQYLSLLETNSVLLSADAKSTLPMGSVMEPGSLPQIQTLVANQQTKSVTALPEIQYFSYSHTLSSKPLRTWTGQPIVMAAGSQQTVTYPLSGIDLPQGYAVELSFIDPVSKSQLSRQALFTFVIKGISSTIFSQQIIGTAKVLAKTELLDLVTIIGPADGNTPLNGNLSLALYDRENPSRAIAQTTQNLSIAANSGASVIPLALTYSGHSLSVQKMIATIEVHDQSGKLLDTYSVPYTQEPVSIPWLLFVLILMVLLLIAVIVKRRNQSKRMFRAHSAVLIGFLIASVVFQSGGARADFISNQTSFLQAQTGIGYSATTIGGTASSSDPYVTTLTSGQDALAITSTTVSEGFGAGSYPTNSQYGPPYSYFNTYSDIVGTSYTNSYCVNISNPPASACNDAISSGTRQYMASLIDVSATLPVHLASDNITCDGKTKRTQNSYPQYDISSCHFPIPHNVGPVGVGQIRSPIALLGMPLGNFDRAADASNEYQQHSIWRDFSFPTFTINVTGDATPCEDNSHNPTNSAFTLIGGEAGIGSHSGIDANGPWPAETAAHNYPRIFTAATDPVTGLPTAFAAIDHANNGNATVWVVACSKAKSATSSAQVRIDTALTFDTYHYAGDQFGHNLDANAYWRYLVGEWGHNRYDTCSGDCDNLQPYPYIPTAPGSYVVYPKLGGGLANSFLPTHTWWEWSPEEAHQAPYNDDHYTSQWTYATLATQSDTCRIFTFAPQSGTSSSAAVNPADSSLNQALSQPSRSAPIPATLLKNYQTLNNPDCTKPLPTATGPSGGGSEPGTGPGTGPGTVPVKKTFKISASATPTNLFPGQKYTISAYRESSSTTDGPIAYTFSCLSSKPGPMITRLATETASSECDTDPNLTSKTDLNWIVNAREDSVDAKLVTDMVRVVPQAQTVTVPVKSDYFCSGD